MNQPKISQKPEEISTKVVNGLPIEKFRTEIVEAIDQNPTTVIVGETGSGKTTRTPVFLLEAFPNSKIAITSPRVLPARSVSSYVAGQMGERVGDRIGVHTRDIKNFDENTKCTFMTDGILLNLLQNDPALTDLDIVMIDEAHERSLNIDLTLGLLKQAQVLRKEKGLSELKIIVASATIEESKFTTYFSSAPLVKVPGRLFPVHTEYFASETDPESGEEIAYTKRAAALAKRILEDSSTEGDILIFMPGEAEIKSVIKELDKHFGDNFALELLPLFGSMNPKDQDRIFAKNDKRKVIVATNIAETSITIETVKHVIDSGYLKQITYNPETGIDTFGLQEASKANMEQRKGRAGRVSKGYCYRLISQESFDEREDFQKPEILRSNLVEVVLKMKYMGIADIAKFDFIDKPTIEAIIDAIKQLKILGALDEAEKITDIGEKMARLPLRPDLSRALIEAQSLNCLGTVIDLCAMLSTSKQLFFRPREDDPERFKKENAQKSLKVRGSDYLTALNVWRKWEEDGFTNRFAFDHLLNIKALQEIGKVRDQLLQVFGHAGISVTEKTEVSSSSQILDEHKAITKCLLVSKPESVFIQQYLRRWPTYKVMSENQNGKEDVSIFPGSSCFQNSNGNFMIADDIYVNEKKITYARRCHMLTIEDLKELVPQMITEEKGEITSGYFRGMYNRQIKTKFNGILIASRTVSYQPTSEELDKMHPEITFQRNESFVPPAPRVIEYDVLQLKVGNKSLSEINSEVISKVKYYWLRDKGFDFDVPSMDEIRTQISLDIAQGKIKDLADAQKYLDKYTLKEEDYIPKERKAEIERLSPHAIVIGNVSVDVEYDSPKYFETFGRNFKRTASLRLDLPKLIEINRNTNNQVPEIDLPLMDQIKFEYAYSMKSEWGGQISTTKTFSNFKELVNYAFTNKEESEYRKSLLSRFRTPKEEIDKLYNSIPGDQLDNLKNLTLDQKVEKISDRLSTFSLVVQIIERILSSKGPAKPINKILNQITNIKKEIRGMVDDLKYDKGGVNIDKIKAKINKFEEILSEEKTSEMLGIIDARYLSFIYENVRLLRNAAIAGDIELTGSLDIAIVEKGIELVMGDEMTLLNEETATDMIINLI